MNRTMTFLNPVLLLAAASATGLFAAHAEAAQKVGVAAAVNTDASSVRSGAAPQVITLGQEVIFNERIVTNTSGLVQILLLDGTTFTVGPDCQLTIDEFVFNPNTGDARVVATIAKGAFRFIGGQTSRQAGGATVKTPMGVIGIRGAALQGDIDPQATSRLSLLFGDEVTFTGPDGGETVLFEAGNTAVISDGGRTTTVRPTTDADAFALQAKVTSDPTQTGGNQQPLTDNTVSSSGIAEANSSFVVNNPPLPTPRPGDINNAEETVADVDQVAQEVVQDTVEDTVDDTVTDPDPPDDPVPTVPVPGRVYSATAVYESDFGDVVNNPGPLGLVGSTPESDFLVQFDENGGLLTAVSPFGGTVEVPDVTGTQGDNGLESINVNGVSPDGPISGVAYAGRGDFAAYFLGINGDPTQPYYILTGTGTDASVLDAQTGDIRTYSLTQDPIQNLDVPFFSNWYYGSLNNTNQTDLLIVEGNNFTGYQSFLTWIDISGTGSNQKSAIFVTSGGETNFLTAPDTRLLSNRRGSYRAGAELPIFNVRGSSIQTMPGPDGSFLFGPNAENAVVGVGVDPSVETYADVPSNFCVAFDCQQNPDPPILYGTHHVIDLVDETPLTDFSRTSRTHTGFMVGMAETETEGLENPFIVSAVGGLPNMILSLDDPSSQVRASGIVTDVNNANPIVSQYFLTFGILGNDFGESTFIDDDTFAATHNLNRSNTRIIQDNGPDLPSDNLTPGSYLVSGRAAPLDGYEHCTQCDFADWGWWGTRVIPNVDVNGEPGRRSDMVHMGTWVAGDITNPADLPSGPTNATYNGTAIANVANNAGQQYIASGGFSLDIDLSNRNGNLAISNLDGANYSAAVSDASTAAQALFSSNSLVGTNGLTGTVSGALVNDGAAIAAGAIGQFEASGGGNQVVGTFVGNR
ncbi:MAG: FecR domain-containing protein [Pseudomonadota bacterium]